MVLFQNCVQQPLPPLKMAAITKNGNFLDNRIAKINNYAFLEPEEK
jgi:hypothetical protein